MAHRLSKNARLRKIGTVLLPAIVVAVGIHAALVLKIPETVPDQVAEIAPGVYFRHGDLDRGHCNNGFVIFEKFVLVVDANFPDGAEKCLADIRKVTDKPVRFVFDTHHHGDHAYGNPVWMANGAVPVAHEKVLAEMKRYEPERWRAEKREDVRKLGLDTAMPPVMTYRDRLVVDDGTQRVELLHFGTAHTRGDGFAYLPKHDVLFSGDAVVNGPYNYMGDGDSYSWLNVLDKVRKLDIDVIAPGHGGLAGKELVDQQKAFFKELHAAVSKGIAAGQSLEELKKSIKLSGAVKKHVGDKLPSQIEKVYTDQKARADS